MGMFDQFKMAQSMMKNMSPDEIKDLMNQAKESQGMMEEQIKKVLDAEIEKRGLISKEEVERLIQDKLS